MGMTCGDAGDPVSVAIAGMGVAGGLSLLVFAGVASYLTLGVLKLREWARVGSIASIVAGIGFTILTLFAFRGYLMIPVVPSIICHLLVMALGVWMLAYLLSPRVKQAFGALLPSGPVNETGSGGLILISRITGNLKPCRPIRIVENGKTLFGGVFTQPDHGSGLRSRPSTLGHFCPRASVDFLARLFSLGGKRCLNLLDPFILTESLNLCLDAPTIRFVKPFFLVPLPFTVEKVHPESYSVNVRIGRYEDL
jgi:hypothetical protein